jgi:F420-0:gamma-glutamyl ligase
MQCIPIKTRIFQPPKDDIYNLLDEYLPKLQERDVVIITSKVMAIHQGRCIKRKGAEMKYDLVKIETDRYLRCANRDDSEFVLSIVENALIASAGIDESNANGYFIYLPKHPSDLCKEICEYLKKKFSLNELAVIAVDSHSLPLRYGTLGIAIGGYGLEPLRNYVGTRDIFGCGLKVSRINIFDSLASLSALVMGEGKEMTPIAIVRAVEGLVFTERETFQDLIIPEEEDMYGPILQLFKK